MSDFIEQLKYPIGRFQYQPGQNEPIKAIEQMSLLPQKLRAAVRDLNKAQLDTSYRAGGWTLRQVVHHLADSHLNAYTRFKLAMTEDNPKIRPYDEAAWAECEEAKHGEILLSLDLLEALHKRWVVFMRSLNGVDFERTYYHPFNNKQSKLIELVYMYAWHGDHHLAHIISAKAENKWQDPSSPAIKY